MRIILASQSPRRAKALQTLGLPFEIIPSDFDEESITEEDSLKLVGRLSLEKARAVARKHPEALVIGGDSMIKIGGRVMSKPRDLKDAFAVLQEARGQILKDFVGLTVIYQGQEKSIAVSANVKMRKYSDKEILDFFGRVNPLDKAGGFAVVPGEGEELVESYDGEPGQGYGLPLDSLNKFLEEFGLKN